MTLFKEEAFMASFSFFNMEIHIYRISRIEDLEDVINILYHGHFGHHL